MWTTKAITIPIQRDDLWQSVLLLLSVPVFREANGPKIFLVFHKNTLGSQNRLYCMRFAQICDVLLICDVKMMSYPCVLLAEGPNHPCLYVSLLKNK